MSKLVLAHKHLLERLDEFRETVAKDCTFKDLKFEVWVPSLVLCHARPDPDGLQRAKQIGYAKIADEWTYAVRKIYIHPDKSITPYPCDLLHVRLHEAPRNFIWAWVKSSDNPMALLREGVYNEMQRCIDAYTEAMRKV